MFSQNCRPFYAPSCYSPYFSVEHHLIFWEINAWEIISSTCLCSVVRLLYSSFRPKLFAFKTLPTGTCQQQQQLASMQSSCRLYPPFFFWPATPRRLPINSELQVTLEAEATDAPHRARCEGNQEKSFAGYGKPADRILFSCPKAATTLFYSLNTMMIIRSHGVMVSTPDSESGNPSSNLGGTLTTVNVGQ